MLSKSEEEVRRAMGRGGERKAGQGTGPETEPLATLRLKVGAETEDPLRRQRTNFAEGAVVAGEATPPERCPRGETSWTPLRDRRLAGGPTCPPCRPGLVLLAVGRASEALPPGRAERTWGRGDIPYVYSLRPSAKYGVAQVNLTLTH